MVGTYLRELLPDAFYSSIDLRCKDLVDDLFRIHKFDYVFHLAAKVGGLGANMSNQQMFYEDNIYINTNVLTCAATYNVKRLISVLSTCVYPAEGITYPLTENQIHLGPPHSSNYGYAYAKRMAHIHTLTLRQWGHDFLCVVPNNLYGKYDNFDLTNSHVIPAIIRKIYEARLAGKDKVELWGDGTPLREFTYAADFAAILEHLMTDGSESDILNVGNTTSHSIKEVALCISSVLHSNSEVKWETEKSNGQEKKPSDCSIFNVETDWSWPDKLTSLEDGLQETCDWFVQKYPNVRGVR